MIRIIFLFIVLIPSYLFSKDFEADSNTRVSLLICTPGDELYSSFGHSAFRVTDDRYEIDAVFNYGTFDFNKPNFYSNFLKGIMIYSLSVEDYPSFERSYVYENRGVKELVLRLTISQKSKLVQYLLNNALPDNRDYPYDFLRDNCATRLRDVLEIAIGEPIVFDKSKFDTTITFRNLIDEYTLNKRWENFGMDLLIGPQVDKPTTHIEQMFLPDYLAKGFMNATIPTDSGIKPLVLLEKKILSRIPSYTKFSFFNPETTIFLFLIFISLISILELIFNFGFRFFDVVFFLLLGIIGLLMTNLWLFTHHWTTAANLNILWALPSHLLIAILLLVKQKSSFLKGLLMITAVVQLSFILFHPFMPQQFQFGVILLSISVFIRAITRYIVITKY